MQRIWVTRAQGGFCIPDISALQSLRLFRSLRFWGLSWCLPLDPQGFRQYNNVAFAARHRGINSNQKVFLLNPGPCRMQASLSYRSGHCCAALTALLFRSMLQQPLQIVWRLFCVTISRESNASLSVCLEQHLHRKSRGWEVVSAGSCYQPQAQDRAVQMYRHKQQNRC